MISAQDGERFIGRLTRVQLEQQLRNRWFTGHGCRSPSGCDGSSERKRGKRDEYGVPTDEGENEVEEQEEVVDRVVRAIKNGHVKRAEALLEHWVIGVLDGRPNPNEPPEFDWDCLRWPVPVEFDCPELQIEQRAAGCGDAPCMPSQPWRELTPQDRDNLSQDIHVVTDGVPFWRFLDDAYIDAVYEAIQMLRDNWPLVEWYCCAYLGENSPICGCISDWIWGRNSQRLVVRVDFNCASDRGDDVLGHADNQGHDIFICVETFSYAYSARYVFAEPWSEEPLGPMCSIVYLAEVILHELCHLCDPMATRHLMLGSTGFVDPCDPITAFGDAVATALSDRYDVEGCPTGFPIGNPFDGI